jgi:hypothetical protein
MAAEFLHIFAGALKRRRKKHREAAENRPI